MNNRNNRATGAILASISLLVIILFAVPWVDEYLRLRGDAAKLTELENRSAELRERNEQLDRIDKRLTSSLEELSSRSIDPTKTEHVREEIVEIVRKAGGRIRRLEIPNGERRNWAIDGDQVKNGTMPIYAEESEFDLHTHTVELQVDGSLQSIQTILREITNQGWLMTTKELSMAPTSVRESPLSLELRLVLYGLAPRQQEQYEEFAHRPFGSSIR
jgi:hypothetical protein